MAISRKDKSIFNMQSIEGELNGHIVDSLLVRDVLNSQFVFFVFDFLPRGIFTNDEQLIEQFSDLREWAFMTGSKFEEIRSRIWAFKPNQFGSG